MANLDLKSPGVQKLLRGGADKLPHGLRLVEGELFSPFSMPLVRRPERARRWWV